MSNFQQVVNEEIRRISRKEIKVALLEMKKQIADLRKTISEQNRRIKALEKQLPPPEEPVKKDSETPADEKELRITPERIKRWRNRLGLTQTNFAALLGVHFHSVNNWESGKIAPQDAQKHKIAALRDMGKRELAKLVAEKNIVVKKAAK